MNRFPRILSMLSWRLLLAACLLNCTPSYALDQARTLTQYSHRIWGQEEGLVQPTIYSIAQTRQGYLWLGTQDGLVRFDGVRFAAPWATFGHPGRRKLLINVGRQSRYRSIKARFH